MSVAPRGLHSPITWYGGKGLLVGRLLPLLPPSVTYVEPFAGGASLLFAREPSPIEVLNDVHDGLVTLYRVLRDPALFAQFERLCHLTPDARVTYKECRDTWATETDAVRKAWAFFVTARLSFSAHTGASASPTWGYSVADPGGHHTRRWLGAVDGLNAVHERLRLVQVDHGDWRTILARYDTPTTLFYVDPPYPLSSRAGGRRYDHEMSMQDHDALIAGLLGLAGMVVLSSYRVPAVHAPLEEAGWERVDLDVPIASAKARAGMRRVESVWRNPAAVQAWQTAQWPLFAAHAARSGPPLRGTEEGRDEQ